MNGFLIDTNVISELTKLIPDKNVIAFLTNSRNLWLSTVILHELEFGINLLPHGTRRDGIHQTITTLIKEYEDRIIILEHQEAKQAALLRAGAQQSGRTVSLGDALIAGTAFTHKLCVATRNISDFEELGVELINPWNFGAI